MCICTHMCVCPHAHVCGSQKLMFGAFLGCFPPLVFDRVSHWVLTHWLNGSSGSSGDLGVGLLSLWPCLYFSVGAGDSNSHSHACALAPLPTKPSPQPLTQTPCVSLVYDPFVICPWQPWLPDFDCSCLALTEKQWNIFN